MKKILLLLAAVTIISCSSYDKAAACDNTVFGYSTNGLPDGSTQYWMTYGPSATNNDAHTVNQSTYNYYYTLSNNGSTQVCWEGPQ